MIISVDLASRRYDDNGIALVQTASHGIDIRIVGPSALGWSGAPDPRVVAEALASLAEREGARLILIDGPQGWRAECSTLVHQRHCERETRTPGKTGLPGVVKPRSWTHFAEFSIAIFDLLATMGWPRLTRDWRGEAAAIESFPTHAWRSLGVAPMPGKSNTERVTPWVESLQTFGVRGLGASVTHDEVQAAVAGLGGAQLLIGGLEACDVRGVDPVLEAGTWREGLIVSPRA